MGWLRRTKEGLAQEDLTQDQKCLRGRVTDHLFGPWTTGNTFKSTDTVYVWKKCSNCGLKTFTMHTSLSGRTADFLNRNNVEPEKIQR